MDVTAYPVGSPVIVAVTPTLSVAGARIANDYVGTSGVAMVFAGIGRLAGGYFMLNEVEIVDKAAQSVALELWLFDSAITPPADNAPWSISDADALHCVAVVKLAATDYFASALNGVANVGGLTRLIKCAAGATSLYGCLVTRGAPTYADGDVTVLIKGQQF